MAISITIPGDEIQLTGNLIKVQCSGASAPAGSTEYMIVLKITSTDSKLEGSPFYMAKYPDASGNRDFNIQGYVDQHVTALFQYPASGAVVSRATQVCNLQIQAGERYIDSNGDLVDSKLTDTWHSSDTLKVLKGGLSQRQINQMNDSDYSFYSKYLQAGRFLTARPWGDFIHPTQPVKLWFMPVVNATKTRYIKAYYDDGTDNTHSSVISLNTDYLYEINCNPTLFGLEMEPTGKKMLYFDVWIDGFDAYKQRFEIDWKYCERPVFLFFANTFGGVDDVYLSGEIRDKFSSEGEISYREPEDTDTVYTPTLMQLDKTGQNKWSINSGFKSLTTIQYFRDLLVSKQAWYLYTNLSQTTVSIIPIVDIRAGDEVLINRRENLYYMNIEFSEAHVSKHSFDNRIF